MASFSDSERIHFCFLLLFFIISAGSCSRHSADEGVAENHYKPETQRLTNPGELGDYILQAMEDWKVPGLAIAIVKDDSVWMAEGFGVREAGKPDPVDSRTMFGLLSPTKTFTTTALAMLVEEGRLSWDDRVLDILPDFRLSDPDILQDLRIRDIVSHRNGYADDYRLWYKTGHDRKELVSRMAGMKPVAPLRKEFHYNNLMYVVAGEVIEAVSGVSWEEFVEQRIFLPLGMEESTPTLQALMEMEGGNIASPHSKLIFNRFGPVRPISYFDADNIAPAGMIHTNVQEMAVWLRFHLNEGSHGVDLLLSPESIRELQQPQIDITNLGDDRLGGDRAFGPVRGFVDSISYGLGWFTGEYRGRPAVWHGGGINGQRSAVGLLPEEGVGVVILSNMQDTEIALALMYQVFDIFSNVEPRDWNKAFLNVQ